MFINHCSDPVLSAELQELYLQNKQWFSDVLFLEDETRFFNKIFDRILPTVIIKDRFMEVQYISASLGQLEARTKTLKELLIRQLHLLESMLKNLNKSIGLSLVNENMDIVEEIKTLFISDKLIKNELFAMVEETMREEKAVSVTV